MASAPPWPDALFSQALAISACVFFAKQDDDEVHLIADGLSGGRFWQTGLPGMLNLEDDTFGAAGIQSGKVLWRPWTLELEVFCTGWTVFLVPSGPL